MAGRKGAERERTLMIVLLVLLIISVSYILYSEHSRLVSGAAQDAFAAGYNQGFLDGVVDSIGKIHSETASCQSVPVVYNNVTKYIIDAGCLHNP